MKNIFIEGMQGTGKTTLLEALSQKLDGYRTYREGDLSPVEMAWCGYLTKEQYEQVLHKFPELSDAVRAHTKEEGDHRIVAYTRVRTENADFYQHMEQFEIYDGRRSLEEFRDIIFRRYGAFREEGNLFECSFFQNIVDDMLLHYLRKSPYGKSCSEPNDACVMAYFDRRRRVEKRIISEVLKGYCVVVEAKKYDLEELVGGICQSGI